MFNQANSLRKNHHFLRIPWVQAILLVLAISACYLNSLDGTWLYDDHSDILSNRMLRELWPVHHLFFHRENATWIFHARPLTWLTFAIDYASGQGNILPFHITSICIHLASTLLLWSIARWAFISSRHIPAHPTALLLALAWGIHPLQTGAVTYIVQRYESLASFCILFTLWTFIQSWNNPRASRWHTLSVLGCMAGLLSKEVAVSTPLIILLFDRAYMSGSFLGALRRHRGLYTSLLITLLVFIYIQTHSYSRASFVGSSTTSSCWEYARNQPAIILYYLRLAIWPHPLLLDVAWTPAHRLGSWVPHLIIVLSLLGATLWTLLRHPKVGFIAASFWLILGPSSSFMPILDMAVQHRMYLPLAAVFSLGAGAIASIPVKWPHTERSFKRITVPLACAAFTLASTGTILRNQDFHDPASLWQQNLDRRPHSWRAMVNAAHAYSEGGNPLAAFSLYKQSIKKEPNLPLPYANLAAMFANVGDYSTALALIREAIRLDPSQMSYVSNLGAFHLLAGNLKEAETALSEAIRREPTYSLSFQNMASLLEKQGRFPEGEAMAREAIRLSPRRAAGYWILGRLLWLQDQKTDALIQFKQAILLSSDSSNTSLLLAQTFLDIGAYPEAMEEAKKGLINTPNDLDLKLCIAWILSTAPQDRLRDGHAALALLDFTPKRGSQTSRHREVMAATRAELGEFKQAETLIEDALAAENLSDERKKLLKHMQASIIKGRPFRDTHRDWYNPS